MAEGYESDPEDCEGRKFRGAIPVVYEASRSNLKPQAFGRLRLRGQVEAWYLTSKPPSFWCIGFPVK